MAAAGDDDEAARRARAERIREQIAAEREGADRPPRTPREFAERAARETAREEERAREGREDDPPAD
jgi:hypothetical protein